MTDLVAQLVGALEDCLDRIEKSEFWWMDCPDRGGFDAETIRAALSEAKAGVPEGVVLVPLTDREIDAAIDKAKAETMYGTHHSGYWRDIGRGVLAAARAQGITAQGGEG